MMEEGGWIHFLERWKRVEVVESGRIIIIADKR